MTIEKDDFGFVVNCDFCSDFIEVDSKDFLDAVQALKDNNWKFSKDENGDWIHECIVCKEIK